MTPAEIDLLISPHAIAQLASNSENADALNDWPAISWNLLSRSDVTAWCIPTQFGGVGLDAESILRGYERIAGACLTTAFILSQRDAAVRRIRDSGSEELSRELLRPLACGGRFATVGISQLTTSRQHGAPALIANETAEGFVIDGVMPWVTAADQAHYVVAGALLPNRQQILLVVPTDTPGLQIDPPMKLAALVGSRTSQVNCTGTFVPRRWLIAGPAEQVLSSARGGTGGLETSCLALGHAGAAIDDLQREALQRPELRPIADRLEATRQNLRTELFQLANAGAATASALALRARANALVLRATQASLTASKGAGFLRPHPAQRRARQALFFLVWSCPRPAAEATLEFLTDGSLCT
jgi:alkylation response protein AidB-like acyl-CoA dehydrogenase